MKRNIQIFTNSGLILDSAAGTPHKKQLKHNYCRVIQQNYGQGWEDCSEYECNSSFTNLEMSDKLSPIGKKESLLSHDLREYKLIGYPTRVINRKSKNP
ncbi:MAG: hypothetical protein WC055_01990 [Melioribacteraceae bacterium]